MAGGVPDELPLAFSGEEGVAPGPVAPPSGEDASVASSAWAALPMALPLGNEEEGAGQSPRAPSTPELQLAEDLGGRAAGNGPATPDIAPATPPLEPGVVAFPKRGRGRPRKDRFWERPHSLVGQRPNAAMVGSEAIAVASPLTAVVAAEPIVVTPAHRRELLQITPLPLASGVGHAERERLALGVDALVGAPLSAAMSLACVEGEALDEGTLRIARAMLCPGGAHITSTVALSAHLGEDPHKVRKLAKRLAAMVVLQSRARHGALEAALAECCGRRELLHYFDVGAHDETPLAVGVHERAAVPSGEQLSFGQDGAPRRAICDSAVGGVVPQWRVAMAGLQVRMSETKQKVVQSSYERVVVAKLLGGGYLSVCTKMAVPLILVERNTAPATKAAQLRAMPVSPARRLFTHATRAVCTDRGSENAPCERSIAAEYFGGPPGLLHVFCEVHMTSGCHQKLFSIPELDKTVHGLINTALALRSGPAMMRFRKCLRDEVSSRLQVLHGAPTRAAQRYTSSVLTMFAQRGPNIDQKRLLLQLCPNGDWRAQQVQYYVDPTGCGPQAESDVVDFVVAGLASALVSSQPPLYPRHRWTGADRATDEVALVECVHKLMSTTFLRYAASFTSGAVRRSLLEAGLRLSAYGPGRRPELEAPLPAGGEQGGAGGDGLAEQGGNEARGPDAQQDWAAINANYRRQAVRFFVGDRSPLGKLMLQRCLMEPLRAYLAKQFDLASADFERRESAKLAAALSRGETGAGARAYRLSLVASGAVDRVFFDQTRVLFDCANLWSALPPSCLTVSFRALAFRGISRQACAFHELLARTHEGFPHQVFKLLGSPDHAEALDAVDECLLDPWTRSMKRAYGFQSADFLHILAGVAQSLAVDISVLEAKHATIRRLLTVLSVQTHAVEFSHLSAMWVLLQARRKHKDAAEEQASEEARVPPVGQAPRAGAKPQRKAKRRRTGGVFNAFVRLATLGARGRPDLASVAARYRAEKVANSDTYRSALLISQSGAAAGPLLPRWRSSFGPRRAEMKRAAVRQRRALLYARVESLEPGERSELLATNVAACGDSLSDALTLARGAALHASKRKREDDRAMAGHLAAFRSGVGAKRLKGSLAARPMLGKLGLAPRPSAFGTAAAMPEVDSDVLAKALAWCTASEKKSSLGSQLDNFWEVLHRCVPDVGGQAEAPAPIDGDATQCWKCGVCVCSPGNTLQRRVNSVLAFLKRSCGVGTRGRAALAQGSLVLRLRGAPRPSLGVEALLVAGQDFPDVWYHIGYQTFSPYAPTFMEVALVDDLHEAPPDERRCYVRATNTFYSMHKGIARVSHCEHLLARLYTIEDVDRAIPAMAPHTVPIISIGTSAAWSSAWGGPRQRRRAGLAAGEDSGGDEEGHDAAGGDEVPLGADDELREGDVVVEAAAGADLLLDLYDLAPPPPVGGVGHPGEEGPAPSEETPPPADVPLPAPSEPPPEVGPAIPPPPGLRHAARAPVRGVGGGRNPPRASVALANGSIAFYESNGNFVAYCAKHPGCVLTRKGRPPSDAAFLRAPQRYRPLGLMTSWLGVAHLWDTKDEHWLPLSWGWSVEEEAEGRADLGVAEGGAALLAEELAAPAGPAA